MQSHMEDWLPRHRITVDEYYRMAEVGLLAADARVELIEGEILDMPPIGSRHAGVVSLLDRLLSRAAGDEAIVRVQLPLRLTNASEPQPDLALVKPRSDYYSTRHPTAADTLLVVEVSQTTVCAMTARSNCRSMPVTPFRNSGSSISSPGRFTCSDRPAARNTRTSRISLNQEFWRLRNCQL